MSRLHMLPPLIYTPPPLPKKIESRKSRIQLQSAATVGAAAEADESDEADGPPAPAPLSRQLPLPGELPIDAATRRPPSKLGQLSQGTLSVLLGAQEVMG